MLDPTRASPWLGPSARRWVLAPLSPAPSEVSLQLDVSGDHDEESLSLSESLGDFVLSRRAGSLPEAFLESVGRPEV